MREKEWDKDICITHYTCNVLMLVLLYIIIIIIIVFITFLFHAVSLILLLINALQTVLSCAKAAIQIRYGY